MSRSLFLKRPQGGRLFPSSISIFKKSASRAEIQDDRRLRFDLRRIMRTRYRIDNFQQLYFVINDFQELFEATRPDFAPIYREVAALPDLEPTERLDHDREFAPRVAELGGRKKIGPHISAAQV